MSFDAAIQFDFGSCAMERRPSEQQRHQGPLMQLPPGAVLRIWEALQHNIGSTHDFAHQDSSALPANASQHLLRCTCRTLRDMTTPWITSLAITVEHGQEAEQHKPDAWAAVVQQACMQVAGFPSSAKLTKLKWDNPTHDRRPGDFTSQHQEVLPTVLWQMRARCMAITTLHIACQWVSNLE